MLVWYPRFDQQRTLLFLAAYSHVSNNTQSAAMYNGSRCILWAIRGWTIDPEAYFSSIESRSAIARIYY